MIGFVLTLLVLITDGLMIFSFNQKFSRFGSTKSFSINKNRGLNPQREQTESNNEKVFKKLIKKSSLKKRWLINKT
jgi:hypothetical protein